MRSGTADLSSRPTQALILTAFVGFQVLDSLTTHLGLAAQHLEMNRVMAPIIDTEGELVAYAVKGTALAIMLGILMLLCRRVPRVWRAYQVAAWLTALAVVANLLQLV